MAAYSGQSKKIKNALMTVLSGITYDAGSGSEPAFVQVLDSQTGEFEGYPSLRVLPGDVTTEKAATNQNMRTVSFIVRVHCNLEETPESESATVNQMYDLTDLIIDSLDAGDGSGALHQADSSLDTLILNATRGDWSYAPAAVGAILLCDVNVSITYSQLFG